MVVIEVALLGMCCLFFLSAYRLVFYLCLLLDDLQDGSVPRVFEFLHYHPVRKRHRLRHGGPLRPRVPRKEVRSPQNETPES